MRILSARNHVLWINYHASRRPRLSGGDARTAVRRLRQMWSGWRRVLPTIDVLSPMLVPFPGSRLARFVNARVLARQIKAALHRLPKRPTQLWLFTPDVPALTDLLSCDRVVYYCVDDFAAFAGFDKILITRLEDQTISASDVVITTSARLYERCKERNPNTHLVPHGVDFDHFAAAADIPPDGVPDDVRHVPRPVFGYIGLLSDYVDVKLLGWAARRKPEWSFVLIGDVRCDVRAIQGLSNVHLLGGRPYDSLPSYCSHIDVGLIPFCMNRLTRAVNPIKLREYLAAGLPVVSAPLPEVLRYAPSVHTAESLDEFIRACSAALAMAGDGNRRARQELVRSESWCSRVQLLSDIICDGERTAR